jgi:hypothetical protein
VEKIHKNFEIPRKIPDVPRRNPPPRAVGSTGVIPGSYKLTLFDSRFHLWELLGMRKIILLFSI